MGVVIAYPGGRADDPVRPPKTDPGCHIVIFPGVRIERPPQTGTAKPPGTGGSRQGRRRSPRIG